MKTFGFIKGKVGTGYLVGLLSDTGHLVTVIEIRSFKKIDEIITKFAQGSEYRFVEKPWTDMEFQAAQTEYESQYGVSFEGYCN